MIDGAVVVDAVVHPYNLDPSNQNREATEQLETVYGAHLVATGPDHPEHLFGSGTNLPHPAPLLTAFDGYELPADMVAEHGYPQLTAQDRRLILGGNALRLHGIDAVAVVERTADDEFARRRASGTNRPWGPLRWCSREDAFGGAHPAGAAAGAGAVRPADARADRHLRDGPGRRDRVPRRARTGRARAHRRLVRALLRDAPLHRPGRGGRDGHRVDDADVDARPPGSAATSRRTSSALKPAS